MKLNRQLLSKWDTQIKAGRATSVKSELALFTPRQIPRELHTAVANTYRRVGLHQKAIKLLHPVIHPAKINHQNLASPADKKEYAANLIEIGVFSESQSLLDEIDVSQDREVALVKAFLLFKSWNYAAAIPLLEVYIDACPSSYAKAVGRLNLAASLVSVGAYEACLTQIEHIIVYAENNQYQLILAKVYEVQAQVYFECKEWEKALVSLNSSRNLLQDSDSIWLLYAKKWRALIQLYREPMAKSGRAALDAVIAAAREVRDWEVLRECDRHLALVDKNPALFFKVFFGTTYFKYREYIVSNINFDLPDFFIYAQCKSPKAILNIDTGVIENSAYKLKTGMALHRLLKLIGSDFYQPFRVGWLYSKLFPDEFYDPLLSPDRVYLSVRRLNLWFKACGFAAEIKESGGGYRLVLTGNDGIKIMRLGLDRKPEELKYFDLINSLAKQHGDGEFSAVDAQSSWATSTRSTHRNIKSLLTNGDITKISLGRATKYKIAS